MDFYGVIMAIQIVNAYSASKIAVPNDGDLVSLAGVRMHQHANIVNTCFGSSEKWSKLLIIPNHASRDVLEKIHYESKTSNLIVFLDDEKFDGFTHPGKCYDCLNTGAERQITKINAVIIAAHSSEELEFVLYSLKKNFRKLWRPGSYILVVVDTQCDDVEYNSMFKVMWEYWILNAVILCPSNDSDHQDRSKIQLYTFNPYSADHSQQWKTMIRETVETLNLDGYVVPIGFSHLELSRYVANPPLPKFSEVDGRLLRTIRKSLRFDVAMVINYEVEDEFVNPYGNSYIGTLDDLCRSRTHLLSVKRGMNRINKPGIEVTYPHERIGVYFVSRIGGNQPIWTNLAEAKHMWLVVGLGLLFSTLVLYLQNRSYGIVTAFLNAERLTIGSSIIRASKVIKHRIILGSIFLVVLVVDGAIKSRFISILTVARPYPNFDSIEQLKGQEIDLYGDDGLVLAIGVPELRLRLRVRKQVNFEHECLELLERGDRQIACVAACPMMQFLSTNYSYVHIGSVPLMTSLVGFPTAMHWPLTNRYSFAVQKLMEAGIYEMWQLDILRELEVASWKLKRAVQPPYVEATEMDELLPAFILLFGGLSVSLIVFTWEMIGGKCISCVKS